MIESGNVSPWLQYRVGRHKGWQNWLYELENIIFCVAARRAAQQNQGKNQRGAAPAEHRPVSGIWAARRARAQRGPAQCSTWPSQVVGWAHRAHGSVAQRCCARTTMRRGPAGLPTGDQLLGCLVALAVRGVCRAQSLVIASGVGAVPRHARSFDTRSSVLLLRLVWISGHGASYGQE